MDARQERGLQIAALMPISKGEYGYVVPSQTSQSKSYIVAGEASKVCTCPDFAERHEPCKHIYAVEFFVQRTQNEDGSETVTQVKRVTYAQSWTTYNAAQTHEEPAFVRLLRDLCDGIEQPVHVNGRPRLPLADVVFANAYRIYSGMSGRRFDSAIRQAEADGLITKAPSYNSAFRYLEDANLTPLLKMLIEQSAAPLRDVETDFAADSSGFTTATYERWYDHKWGKERLRHAYVKAHIMCGVKTHVVTAVEATPYESADNRQMPYLVERTARQFEISEVSGDKAYSDRRNLHAVEAVGGTPYIPFKVSATGNASAKRKFDGLWHRMWHFYNYNRAEFNAHYHKRSNVETAFSMIKMKFGGAIRAKTPVAQVNEVLLKVLCHNIVVLVQSMYELGLEPMFWQGFEANSQPAPKLFQKVGF